MTGLHRRRLLSVAASGLSAWWLTSCRTGPAPSLAPYRAEEFGRAQGSGFAEETAWLALLASLENLAVSAYDLALERFEALAADGEAIAPVAVEAVTAWQDHHRTHAQTWNELLAARDLPTVDGRNLTYKSSLDVTFRLTAADRGVVGSAAVLELVLGATCLDALNVLPTGPVFDAVAAVAPVELAHSAVLSQLAGAEPTPAVFASRLPARRVTDILG